MVQVMEQVTSPNVQYANKMSLQEILRVLTEGEGACTMDRTTGESLTPTAEVVDLFKKASAANVH